MLPRRLWFTAGVNPIDASPRRGDRDFGAHPDLADDGADGIGDIGVGRNLDLGAEQLADRRVVGGCRSTEADEFGAEPDVDPGRARRAIERSSDERRLSEGVIKAVAVKRSRKQRLG